MLKNRLMQISVLLLSASLLVVLTVLLLRWSDGPGPYEHLQLVGEVRAEDDFGQATVAAYLDDEGELYLHVSQFYATGNENLLYDEAVKHPPQRLGTIVSEDGKLQISVDRVNGELVPSISMQEE